MPPSRSVRIGNQTAFSAPTPTLPFWYAVENGFDAFEWFPDKKTSGAGWEERDLDAETRAAIRSAAQTHRIRQSVHARWQANPLNPESLPVLIEDIALAKDMGAVLLNVHLCAESGLEAYVQALLPLFEPLAEAGLRLTIENTPRTTPEQFNQLFGLVQKQKNIPASLIGMCLDVGHANLCSATLNDYLKYLDQLGPHIPIIHLHLHENFGDQDAHLPIFTGPAGRDDTGVRGLVQRLQRHRFAGSIILEQWPAPPSLLNEARNKLMEFFRGDGPGPSSHEPGRDALPRVRAAEHRSPTGFKVPVRDRKIMGAFHESPGGTSCRGPTNEVGDTPTLPTSGSASDFLATLVEANQRCRSWREKLDWMRHIFLDEQQPLTTEQLVDLAIYLRFLAIGEVRCTEDGRHFRPSHHAQLSVQIQNRLAQLTTPENAFVMRKIHPWLPSSDEAFRRAEPLTRIRDIAHRNDIPADLKKEIKHSLQNKLHRCAGPEDLATSAALLERITQPGAPYSPAFVEQFQIFHTELREFFNAHSLEERLAALARKSRASLGDSIRQFLTEKARPASEEPLNLLRLLTALRRRLPESESGHPVGPAQDVLLADLGLEDYAFVVLSRLINRLHDIPQPGEHPALLETMALAVANLSLSSVWPEECRAIEAELRAWRQAPASADREHLLRLKATVDRARRLAESYSDQILSLFRPRAEILGRALGVSAAAIRVFADAEIRGHLVFQLAKLASQAAKSLREQLGLPPWDVLVAGRATGRLVTAQTLDDVRESTRETCVVWLHVAEGDEEIPPQVAGIILAHELPLLSHLGVRARQAQVVFVSGEEAGERPALESWVNQWVTLEATPEAVKIQPAVETADRSPPLSRVPVNVPAVSLKSERPWIALDLIKLENGGAKAYGARRLAELARDRTAGFKALPGVVVPFGVMEQSIRSSKARETEYRDLANRLNAVSLPDFERHRARLHQLVAQLEVPPEITGKLLELFGPDGRLMVRSSANGEDLPGFAGAGLYQSVANVTAAEAAAAIQSVWASLWTRRAAISRRETGIPHAQAHMAVLIQPLITPDLSFVMHTVNPLSSHFQECIVEMAVGLGETLAAAATRGNPYRLVCHKQSGDVRLDALASFSTGLWPDPAGGLREKTVDYSRSAFSCDSGLRRRMGARLATIAGFVERALGGPQDIEGALVGQDIYLVQSRSQPGERRLCS